MENLHSSMLSGQAIRVTVHTALVEPPITLMTAMALRKDLRVTMSLMVPVSVVVWDKAIRIERTLV